jgi:hypothetical protein
MLLVDLLKLFSSQLDINEDTLISIISNNNIKLDQKLTLKNKTKQPIINRDVNIVSANSTNVDIGSVNKEKRSRGRPRKQCNIVTQTTTIPEDVNYEVVEAITYNEKNYYKTHNGVLLDCHDYKVRGVIVDNQTIMQ